MESVVLVLNGLPQASLDPVADQSGRSSFGAILSEAARAPSSARAAAAKRLSDAAAVLLTAAARDEAALPGELWRRARAMRAQAAALSVAARAIARGDAGEAGRAGDMAAQAAAVVDGAGRSSAGEQVSLGAAPGATVMSVTAGNTEIVPRVRSYTLAPNAFVDAQKSGSELHLYGKKAGSAQLVYEPESGGSVTLQVNVTGLSVTQAATLVDKTWSDIKSVLNEPALTLDWQDAAALRVGYTNIRKTLVTLRNSARDTGSTGAKYEAELLIKILDYAHTHEETTSLRECVIGAVPSALTERSLTRAGRECQPGRDGAAFGPLYAFAQDYGLVMDVLAVSAIVIAAIATAVASVFTLGGAAVAAGVVAAAAAAAAAGAKALPAFVADPDKLVRAFGSAVCAAINDGALPARVRAAAKLRAVVTQKYGPYRLAKQLHDNPATSAAEKARLEPVMATYIRNAQAALVGLQTLDQPDFFARKDAAGAARFTAAATAFRALDASAPAASPSGGAGGGAGAAVAAGAAAVAAAIYMWTR